MKQNIKIPIVGLFLLLVLFSCDDEFLKVKPKSFFTPENVYIDKAGFESALIAMKMDLRAEHTGYINYIAAEFSASEIGRAHV